MSDALSEPVTVAPCESSAERAACMAIRLTVFVEEQNVPLHLEADEYDGAALHLLARAGVEGLGTARLVDKGNGLMKIGRVAVMPAHRSRGVGRALMDFALEYASAHGFTVAALDAQLPVIPFYEKIGFVAEGPVFDDAGIDHRHMTRKLSLP